MLTETIITDEESLLESFQDNKQKTTNSRKTEFSSVKAGKAAATNNEAMLIK